MTVELLQRAFIAFETRKKMYIAVKWPKADNGKHGVRKRP